MSFSCFIDESGDLGWSFDAPYRSGGSSRFLTIGSLCIPVAKEYLAKRVVHDLYKKFGWNAKKEKKWADLSNSARQEFARTALKLREMNPDIHFHTITVKKENVQAHIRLDPNKLYNYMIRLSLLNRMALHPLIHFVPDPRSIKIASGNSLPDYLQLELWFGKRVQTVIKMHTRDSHQCEELQFADMLCGLVQSFHEDNEQSHLAIIGHHIQQSHLFF
jgi:hypothetical protein